ncbi:MAG: formate--tetrahydrofolate ligase, partial [bacterium]
MKVTDLDATKLADWEVAAAMEPYMKTCHQLGEELGLKDEELIPMGHHIAKVDFAQVLKRLKNRKNGKYIEVTAITPTPLGEG